MIYKYVCLFVYPIILDRSVVGVFFSRPESVMVLPPDAIRTTTVSASVPASQGSALWCLAWCLMSVLCVRLLWPVRKKKRPKMVCWLWTKIHLLWRKTKKCRNSLQLFFSYSFLVSFSSTVVNTSTIVKAMVTVKQTPLRCCLGGKQPLLYPSIELVLLHSSISVCDFGLSRLCCALHPCSLLGC